MYLQTGDVLYKQVNEIPVAARKVQGDLIHKGENHHHTIKGSFGLFDEDGTLYIDAVESCELLHEEHKTLVLPVGKYRKDIVLEYDHFLEESRRVID